jgi:hypothetical protein
MVFTNGGLATRVFLAVGVLCLIGLFATSGSPGFEAGLLRSVHETRQRRLQDFAEVEAIAERMRPRDLQISADGRAVAKKQFFHLHHMKTGGTSMTHLVNCGLHRAEKKLKANFGHETKIQYYNLEECSGDHYLRCLNGEDWNCVVSVNTSAVMSFCAPLFTSNKFGWQGADAVTVLRHPVDRVWSMFRFQTRSCFQCKSLVEIYEMLDSGDTSVLGLSEVRAFNCLSELQNQQTRYLTNRQSIGDYEDENERVNEAIHNLKTRFAVVGLTEDIARTAEMVGEVFPWLAEVIADDPDVKCPIPHANASPQNNHCGEMHGGEKSSHWTLPSKPDEETRRAILKHNQLDLKLYEAAVEHFDMQNQALELRKSMRRGHPEVKSE